MERIIIEVDDAVARRWRTTSQKNKTIIANTINKSLDKVLNDIATKDFLQFLDELRDKMEERGLTQEILDEILKDE